MTAPNIIATYPQKTPAELSPTAGYVGTFNPNTLLRWRPCVLQVTHDLGRSSGVAATGQ